MADGERYFAIDADVEAEGARLRLIERASDAATFRHLDRLGVRAGWRCLEVGAGGGSVAAWLGERVGPTGRVLALDLDIRHLEWIRAQNVSIRRQNIVTDDVGDGGFDLVHFRALLEHIHDRERAMSRMANALRLAGWLLGEGGDFDRYRAVTVDHPLATVFESVMTRTFSFIKDADIFDPFAAPLLPHLLSDAGFEDIGVDDEVVTVSGGEPMASMFEMSWERFDDVLKRQGVITDEEAAARHAAHYDPTFSFTYSAFAAWGRRATGQATSS
jgi:SAM-dependent methyltransferase